MIYLKTKTIIIILIIIGVCLIHTLFSYNKDKDDITIPTSINQPKYEILVDVEESKLYVFENDELIKTYPCSGGKWSTPSPIGTWTIISKQMWGEGFGGSWMRDKCAMGAVPEYTELQIQTQLVGQVLMVV